MSIVSWNCHGLGTPWALQFLKEVVLQKKPSYVFLCETLCRKGIVERVRSSLGFEGTIVVEAIGHSGGIALLWRNKDAVSLCSFSKNHIDGIVTTPEGVKYRLTGVYGEPDRSKRHETWSLIRSLASHNTLP